MIMPDMAGDKTFEALQQIDPEVRVLLSSGYSIDGQARQILDRGCNGFIQKPFTLRDLSEKLKEMLNIEP
jgi:CheY-like chemotaxis protein